MAIRMRDQNRVCVSFGPASAAAVAASTVGAMDTAWVPSLPAI